jgi:hypothetical protein
MADRSERQKAVLITLGLPLEGAGHERRHDPNMASQMIALSEGDTGFTVPVSHLLG